VTKDNQIVLKPQDFVVALKLAVNHGRDFLLIQLAEELGMPLSAVHGSIRRGEVARLVSRSAGSIRPVRSNVKEFAIYGVKYAFPGLLGTSTRGIPTAIGAPVLAAHFERAESSLSPVWPTAEGATWGLALVPIHPSVPVAATRDKALYEALALLDAIRVGAARERELAVNELNIRL
jgi:hypothetical protein